MTKERGISWVTKEQMVSRCRSVVYTSGIRDQLGKPNLHDTEKLMTLNKNHCKVPQFTSPLWPSNSPWRPKQCQIPSKHETWLTLSEAVYLTNVWVTGKICTPIYMYVYNMYIIPTWSIGFLVTHTYLSVYKHTDTPISSDHSMNWQATVGYLYFSP